MDQAQSAYNLVALRRAARTLAADAEEVRSAARRRGRAARQRAGCDGGRRLVEFGAAARVHWSLVHTARALPWLRTETQLLLAALPVVLGPGGGTGELPSAHPWQDGRHASPLRLDEDLFDAQFGL